MKLKFEFGGGGTLSADLLPERIEKTTAAISADLPINSRVYQARWSGKEIFVPVSLTTKPPRENQNIRAAKGDIIYFCEWAGDYDYTGFEAIGLFYGNEIVREWRGDCPVNVIGHIDPSQFELLEKLGERIWREGGETMTITAVGG